MNMSIREAKARFSKVANTAAGGEKVIITKNGRPFVAIVAIEPEPEEEFFVRLNRVRKELGLDGLKVTIDADFDDPAYSRRVLGLDP